MSSFTHGLFRNILLNFQISKHLEIFQISLLLIYNLILWLGNIYSVLWNLLRLPLWLSFWLSEWVFHGHLKPFLFLILARKGKTTWIENKTVPLFRLRCGSNAGWCVHSDFAGVFCMGGGWGGPSYVRLTTKL